MAGKKNKTTSRLAGSKRREQRKMKRRAQRWENIKLEAFRLYIEEDKSLEATMSAIEGQHGLKSCERSWKSNLNEWGYKKNITKHEWQFIIAEERERALKGKHTACFHRGIRITTQRIENFKARQTRDVPPGVPIPSHILCHTPPPSLNGEENSPKTPCKGSVTFELSPSQTSRYPMSQTSSLGFISFEVESPLPSMFDLNDDLTILRLDQYICEELQPWSTYSLSHQLGDHDAVLAKHRETIAQVTELETFSEQSNSALADLPDERNFCSGLSGIEKEFVESYSQVDCELGIQAVEVSDLGDLFQLAALLANCQLRNGEYATPTLKVEMDLAKTLERRGNYEEAEYHCRRILDTEPQIMVQTLLGMILAKNARLEESTVLLFSALTWFIIEFTSSDPHQNASRFQAIEPLLGELIWNRDEDWSFLTSCVCQMMVTMMEAESEWDVTDVKKVSPQLLIHGFSIAHECMALEFNDSAKYLYAHLLHQFSQMDVNVYGVEMAAAYRDYGFLLSEEGRWISSAEQLLLACESANNSGTYDRRLIARLKRDFTNLLPRLAAEPNDPTLVEKIRKSLTRVERQPSLMQTTLNPAHLSRIENYLVSDLPPDFITFEPQPDPHVAQLGLSSRITNSVDGDEDSISTAASTSVSHKHGLLTYPESVATGISYSIFMVP